MWPSKDKTKDTLKDLLAQRESYLLEQMEIKHQLNLLDEKIEYFNSLETNCNSASISN